MTEDDASIFDAGKSPDRGSSKPKRSLFGKDQMSDDESKSKKRKTDETLDPQKALNDTNDQDPDFQDIMNEYGATKPKALADPTTDSFQMHYVRSWRHGTGVTILQLKSRMNKQSAEGLPIVRL